MSLASSTGLVSGIDYNSILTKLRQANQVPISLIQNKESKIENQRAALQNVNKAILAFKTAAEDLSKSDSFLTITASTDDATVLLASAKNTALPGSYSVKVRQLAQAHRLAAQGVATKDKTSIATGSGTFKFSVGDGAEIKVDVTAGMTLQQLTDAINNATGSKVRASIVSDGSATNPYRLVLTSQDSGTANKITILNNDTTLNLSGTTIEEAAAGSENHFNGTITTSGTYTGKTGKNIVIEMTSGGGVGTAKYKVSYDGGVTWSANDAFTTSTSDVDVTGTSAEGVNVKFAAGTADFAVGDRFTIDTFVPELQKAQNAIIEVDGVQVSRSTNTFDDVIDGVTLTARKVDEDAQTVRVQNSNNSVQTKVKAFVDAYNSLLDTATQATKYDTEKKQAAILFGDSGVNSVVSQARSIIGDTISGQKTYSTLSSVGIKVNRQGKLEVDNTTLNDALNKNLDEVKNLFVEAGRSSNSSIQFSASTEDTTVRSYTVNITTVAEQATVVASRALESTGLASDEQLMFAWEDKAASVSLAAGQTLDQVILQLNTLFNDKSIQMQASKEDGKLKLTSTQYGSDQKISVSSNKDASAAGQLGIGTTLLADQGVDVAGTINGVAATGKGQKLTAASGTDAKGLELLITAIAPTTGTINLTHGIALKAFQRMEAITDSTSGLLATREKSYNDQIKNYDDQIEKLQARLEAEDDRMKKQFLNLETKLAALQSQNNSLQSQLSSLVAS